MDKETKEALSIIGLMSLGVMVLFHVIILSANYYPWLYRKVAMFFGN